MWPPLNGHMDFTAPPLVGPHTKKRPGLPHKGRILEIEAGFCHVKFCHKIKGLEHILGRSRGGTLFQDVAPTKRPHGLPQLLL